jgi:TPR repeat protein
MGIVWLSVLLLLLTPRPAFADFAAASAALARHDYRAAFTACKAEAASGDARCQNLLGYLYEEGRGVSRDLVRAVRLFRRAAEQGFAPAENNLGRAYETGRGVPRDLATAADWFRKAALQHNAEGANALAILYARGEGVPHDPDQAAVLFHRAAMAGYPPAQLNYGLALERGRIVRRDLIGAYIWLRIASRPSSPPEVRRRAVAAAGRIAEKIPAKALDDARRRAEEWHPGGPDPHP